LTRTDRQQSVNLVLIAAGCTLLLVLPFVTTFNDLLTTWALGLGSVGPMQAVAPLEGGMAVALLNLIGIHAGVAGSELVVWDMQGKAQALFISWNCVGWQSLILFGITLAAGLRGSYPPAAKVQVVLIGLLGTVLVNVVRIALVCLLAAVLGRVPAILFHDYGGTLLVMGWLFVFWIFIHRWILPPDPSEELEAATA